MELYPWIVFGHIAGAFVFAMSHGVGAWSSFRLDRERDPVRVRALLELMGESLIGVYIGLLALLIFGIWAGIAGSHFARAWIWVSLGLLIAIAVAMYLLATRYYAGLREAVGLRSQQTKKDAPDPLPVPQADLDAMLARNPSAALAAVGFGGLALILLLMVIKPF
jgi:uncharacterized membrane protein YccC